MPRKPTKKSPAKRMKPPTTRIAIIDNNDKQIAILHVAVEIPRVTELPAPTDSHTGDEGRKLREIRELCETIHRKANPAEDALVYTEDILRILNQKATTPTAKGGRK